MDSLQSGNIWIKVTTRCFGINMPLRNLSRWHQLCEKSARWKQELGAARCTCGRSVCTCGHSLRCLAERHTATTSSFCSSTSGHLSHGRRGETPRRPGRAAPGHQLQLAPTWARRCAGLRAAGEAAVLLRGSHRHGHQGEPGQEADSGRDLRLHRRKVPVLWEE